MPRAQGGIGRQGKTHKRAATHDLQRQLKVQGTSAAPPATATPVQESTAIEEEADPAQASGDPEGEISWGKISDAEHEALKGRMAVNDPAESCFGATTREIANFGRIGFGEASGVASARRNKDS